MTPEPSEWVRMVVTDPDHSHRYIECFRIVEVAGHDLYGEVRTVDAMALRRAHTLDAGYGSGRHTGRLFEREHHVVGVDVDSVLIAAVQGDYPEPAFLVDGLAELGPPARGIKVNSSVVLSAENVIGFLAPSTHVETLCRLRDHLIPEGRVMAGFGTGRGYEFTDFLEDAQTTGPGPKLAFSIWDLHPWHPDSDFLAVILTVS